MPHQCTNCGRQFADGSKEMLSGCPDCGGNKFQFQPKSAAGPGASNPPDGPDPADASDARPPPSDDPFSTPWPSRDEGDDPSDDADIIEADPDPPVDTGDESPAQADARRDLVSPDEVAEGAPAEDVPDPEARSPPDPDGTVASTPDDDRPDLAELRDELNEQFESIRVLNPGQYELNLMELYDREEYIISLREDGRYVIEVPETWRDADPD
ncbi:MAG: Zn-ribbon containing protein [Haloferacaceae archaeon]